MPAVQTTYPLNIRKAVEGQPASQTGWDADTKIVETAAGIGFGKAVSRGTADRGIIIGGTDFVGITWRDVTLIHATADLDKYVQRENAGVMVRGDIWVIPVNDVTMGLDVLFDAVTGQLGKTAGTRIPSARWMTSGLAGSLCIVRLGDSAAPHDLDIS